MCVEEPFQRRFEEDVAVRFVHADKPGRVPAALLDQVFIRVKVLDRADAACGPIGTRGCERRGALLRGDDQANGLKTACEDGHRTHHGRHHRETASARLPPVVLSRVPAPATVPHVLRVAVGK